MKELILGIRFLAFLRENVSLHSARGDTPLFGLKGYVPLIRVWFSGSYVLKSVYNFTI